MAFAFSPDDADRVARAVAAAERDSDGEIVTVIAAESDRYHDLVAHYATLAALVVAAVAALVPGVCVALLDRITGRWGGWAPGELVVALLIAMIAAWLIVRLVAGKLRYRLVPAATATRRVRARAQLLFRLAAENRTRARTGVLVYLSLAEHRAEIVADRAIAAKVDAAAWGEAMALLLAGLRDGRAGDGMVAAVTQVGAVLAAHFPRSPDDTNELSDRPIIL